MTAFVRRSLSDLAGWQEADHALAFAAFRRSAERLRGGALSHRLARDCRRAITTRRWTRLLQSGDLVRT